MCCVLLGHDSVFVEVLLVQTELATLSEHVVPAVLRLTPMQWLVVRAEAAELAAILASEE